VAPWIVRVRKRVLLRGAAIVSAMVVGLLAACSHGGGGGGTAAPAGNAGFQAYADCLRQHGVNLPSARPRPSGVRPSGRGPGGGGFFGSEAPPGVDQGTWDSAQQACASVRPSFGSRGGGNNSAFQAYRNCLREHGLTASNGPGDFDTADPKVAAAMATCAPLRPTGRPSAS
jgi:hypothetical protein